MKVQATISDTPPMQFYRVKHWFETGNPLRERPEVNQMDPDHRTDFTASFQMLSYLLNTVANPLITANITGDKWRILYDSGRAFTNEMGFNDPADPRVDYVNVRDLDKPLPRFHRPLICGGATITGVESGSVLLVDTLRASDPAPSLDWLLAHWWLYFDAVSIGVDGISRFPQGTADNRVFVPLVTTQQVSYPLALLEKLPLGSGKADPYFVP